MRVAVSGANGFVGQALAQHLAINGHQEQSARIRRSSALISTHQKVISAHHAPAWGLGVLVIACGGLLQAAGT